MDLNQDKLDIIISMAREYGATRLLLFGSAAESPESARDLDLACAGVAGWKLYELAARLEEELRIPLDIVPLSPSSRFTRRIEEKGRVLL